MIKKNYDIVCLVSNDLSLDRRMIRICKTLVASGMEVLLVGRQCKTSSPLRKYKFDQCRIQCSRESGMLFYLELVLRFRSLLNKLNYKKLLLVDLDTVLVTRLIRKNETSFILDLHEFFEEVPELKNQFLKRKIWQLIGRICITRCDLVYTVNKSLADIFSRRYQRNVGVVRNIPSLQISPQRKYDTQLNTVYLGVLNPGRGLEEIIHCVKKRPSVSLTLIGDGPLNQHLRQIGNGHKNISFVGAQEPDMITTALENMNIGWNLLDDSSQSYYYSLANKFFDYLHHGLPVITMDFPEYKEVIDHYNCGFLLPNIEEGTIDKMLDQLELSFNQDGTFEHYYKNCLRAAQENNWDQESSKLLELINSV